MKKALLIGINNTEFDNEIAELTLLCAACNIEVIDTISQNLSKPNPKYYLGPGKVDEIVNYLDSEEDIDVIVSNDELSASQIEHLENKLDVTIYDRTFIILEIFRSRARTKESQMQVDIATLHYQLPRLKGLRENLSRQGGGGINRGKGETQLELDKRVIEDKMNLLEHELKELTEERKIQRMKRQKNNLPVVSLVGYTNSGKSTLMNTLLGLSNNQKVVLTKDMLFATLETTTRLVNVNNNFNFLLTDTVGFVSKLPHTLVEAFKSTLEEVKESDLLLEVVDGSNKNFEAQIAVTNKVLAEIGASNIPILYVINKMDKVDDYLYLPPIIENGIRISALDNNNISELMIEIERLLESLYHFVTLHVPYENGNVVNLIKGRGQVLAVKYEETQVIEAKLDNYLYSYLAKYIVK